MSLAASAFAVPQPVLRLAARHPRASRPDSIAATGGGGPSSISIPPSSPSASRRGAARATGRPVAGDRHGRQRREHRQLVAQHHGVVGALAERQLVVVARGPCAASGGAPPRSRPPGSAAARSSGMYSQARWSRIAGHPAHEPADRLAEEQVRGRGRSRRRRPGGAGCRRPRDTIRTATSHGSRPAANPAIRSIASGSSEVTDDRVLPEVAAEHRRDAAGVLLVDGDDEAARVRLVAAHVGQPLHRLAQHGRQPLAVDRERRAQPLVGELAGQRVVERRRVDGAVRRAPLHLAADPREVHRPHDAAVAQRVAVAVLEVRDGLVGLVAHERDRPGVAAERRARQGQAPGALAERDPQALAPRLVLARVVDLVEDDDGAPGERRAARQRSSPPAGSSSRRRACPAAGRRRRATSAGRDGAGAGPPPAPTGA